MDIRKELFSLAEADFKAFNQRINPGVEGILGVRTPTLRKLAKRIATAGWREYLETARYDYFEEKLLAALVIGYADAPTDELLEQVRAFLPHIDGWAVCDTFCVSLKAATQHQAQFYTFLRPYLQSPNEFDVRFAIVMLLFHYIDDSYIDELFPLFDAVSHEGYYVKMAVAWAVSMCYVQYPCQTTRYLESNQLDDFTHNKSIQKIIESRQVDATAKTALRALRRK